MWRVVCAVAAGAIGLGSAVALIGVSAWLIAYASQQPPIHGITIAAIAVRALGISRGVFRYLERLWSHDVALRAVVNLRTAMYRSLARADSSVVTRLRRGDVMARFGADMDAVTDVMVKGLLPFPVAVVVAALAVGTCTVVHPPAGAVMAVGCVVAGVVSPWLAWHATSRATRDEAAARTEIIELSHVLVDSSAELEVTGELPRVMALLDDAERRANSARNRAARVSGWSAALHMAATLGTVWVSAVITGPAAVSGEIQDVFYPIVVLLPLAAFEATAVLPTAAAELVRGSVAARRITERLDPPSDRHDVAADPAAPIVPVAGFTHLSVEEVNAGWLPERPLRTHLTFVVRPGDVVALVGASGSGKTTALLTIAGLLPPLSGTVTVHTQDGTFPLSDLPEANQRGTVSFTSESAHIFHTTIAENLRVAAGDVGDDALHAALNTVGLSGWVNDLPDGLDTVVGSDAIDISGGQRRRLLIARAILTPAPVVVLDEPTEHLDDRGAQDLLAKIALLARQTGRAVIVATHHDPEFLHPTRVISFDAE